MNLKISKMHHLDIFRKYNRDLNKDTPLINNSLLIYLISNLKYKMNSEIISIYKNIKKYENIFIREKAKKEIDSIHEINNLAEFNILLQTNLKQKDYFFLNSHILKIISYILKNKENSNLYINENLLKFIKNFNKFNNSYIKQNAENYDLLYRFENATLGYNKNSIIFKEFNFEIKNNTFLAIIGPNGCGKTTLIKNLVRILSPIKGNLYYHNTHIKHIKTKQYSQNVAYVPQLSEFPTGITVREFVKIGRFPHGQLIKNLKKFEKYLKIENEIIDEAMKKAIIYKYKNVYLEDLSGGLKQRVLIALALAQESDTIILDEPTNHLDISAEIKILKILNDLKNKHGKNIILVIHNINSAIQNCDEILVLKDGNIVGYGKPENIINEKLIKNVFNVNAKINKDKKTQKLNISKFWRNDSKNNF